MVWRLLLPRFLRMVFIWSLVLTRSYLASYRRIPFVHGPSCMWRCASGTTLATPKANLLEDSATQRLAHLASPQYASITSALVAPQTASTLWDLVGVWTQMSASDVPPFLYSAVLSGISGRRLSLSGAWWLVIPLSLHAVDVTGMLIACFMRVLPAWKASSRYQTPVSRALARPCSTPTRLLVGDCLLKKCSACSMCLWL